MKITLIFFTDRGMQLAEKIRSMLRRSDAVKYEIVLRRCSGGEMSSLMEDVFHHNDALFFIGAAGIAVRAIAPHIRSKLTDPAVLVADELGHFVIPILSGHVGGANDLALLFAAELGMVPVITTATDIHGLLSIDGWAVKRGLRIENASKIKEVSMKILSGKAIRVKSEFDISNPPGEFLRSESASHDIFNHTSEQYASSSPVQISTCPDVYIGVCKKDCFSSALCLVPGRLFVGIGCKRGISPGQIEELFDEVFDEYSWNPSAVRCLASIDLKADEEALQEFAKMRGYDIRFFGSLPLAQLSDSYGFTSSDFVKRITGVGSVCERAAIKAAEEESEHDEKSEGGVPLLRANCKIHADIITNPNGDGFPRVFAPFLILRKRSKNGVTIAVACSPDPI